MDVMTQFNKSQYYSFYKVDEYTYYVRRKVPNLTIQHDSPPRFDRTRVVRIEQSIDEKNIFIVPVDITIVIEDHVDIYMPFLTEILLQWIVI